MDSVYAEHFLSWSQICFKTLHPLNDFIMNSRVVLFLCLDITTHQNHLRKCQVNNNREKNPHNLCFLISVLLKLCYSRCMSIANALFISHPSTEAAICDKVWSLEHAVFFISEQFLISVCVSDYCKSDRRAVLFSHRAVLVIILCFSQFAVWWTESFL